MKIETGISRRRFLELTSALGGMIAYGSLNPLVAQGKRLLTEEQVLGPFYPMNKPLDRDADLTHVRGRRSSAKGQILHLMGSVMNPQGKPLPGIRLEIWQANVHGRYLTSMTQTARQLIQISRVTASRLPTRRANSASRQSSPDHIRQALTAGRGHHTYTFS